jgi:hypothetical protein
MALTDAEKAAMCAATYEAALVLMDDLEFLRETFRKTDPTTGDVRRISVILRRLLLDNHLQIVAGPRVGRIRIPIPDDAERLQTADGDFVTMGVAPMFDAHVFREYRVFFDKTGNFIQIASDEPIDGKLVTIDGLMADRVMRLSGEYATRGDILKFICYHAYGAHFVGKPIPSLNLLKAARYPMVWSRDDDGMLRLSIGNVNRDPPRHRMDLVHAHAFSTGYLLTNAPDVLALETVIHAESAAKDSPH